MYFAAKKAYIKPDYDLDEEEGEVQDKPRRLQRKQSFEYFSESSLNLSLCAEDSDLDMEEDEHYDMPHHAPDISPHLLDFSSSPELRSSSPPSAEVHGDYDCPSPKARAIPQPSSEEAKQVPMWIKPALLKPVVEDTKQAQQPMRRVQGRAKKDPQRNIFKQKIDSNVVAIRMNCLQEAGQIATGDSVLCSTCSGALNEYSTLVPMSDSQKWTCEFCEQDNTVSVEPEEFPTSSTVDYLLMSAEVAADQRLGGADPNSDISVIFCIDTSGSMCVTQPVAGDIQLKVRQQPKIEGLEDFDMREQYLPGDRGVTYISRMQCVQASIESQLEEMARACPERKVGIVTFNSDVTIIGDGTTDPYTLAGDKLNSFQACYEAGINWQSKMTNKIADSRAVLTEKLLRIEETGPTALGPALLASVGLASKGRPGSKVIICTDGLANIGLGNLADCYTAEDEQAASAFYIKVGEIARELAIEVSVISIKGEACKLSHLSKVAELTNGDVNQVEPTNLAKDFANILSTPLIATKVSAVVKIHRGLTFRNVDEYVVDQNTLRRELGNVTADTEFTFEYYVRPKTEALALGIDLERVDRLTFQTQIHYTTLDGNRYMRVITACQEMTHDKEDAEKEIDIEVIAINAAQCASKAVQLGNVKEAKGAMRGWRNMIKRNVVDEADAANYEKYVSNLDVLQHEIRGVEQPEHQQADSVQNLAYRARHANKKKECVVW
jgi:hypothetical protein